MERINTYEQWLSQEGIPVIRGLSVYDLLTVPVEPWPRKGGVWWLSSRVRDGVASVTLKVAISPDLV